MKDEKELLELFQVEELEQRFEMGWFGPADATPNVPSQPYLAPTAKFPIT